MEVREAARLIHERDIGALPVVALHGRIVGMLTATDVMHSFLSGRDPRRGRGRPGARRLGERTAG